MKKIFFELTSNTKKKDKKDRNPRNPKVPELIAQEIVSSTPGKSLKVRELLKDSELRFIEAQYKQEEIEQKRNPDQGRYVVCAFMDTVVDEKGDTDTSWLEAPGCSTPTATINAISSKVPDMREYFEKRSVAPNVNCGDTRMLRKLFWFREKEYSEVKARVLTKALLHYRKSLHFSHMFAYLSKKLEMPSGSHVLNVAWSGCDGFLACGCDNGVVKVLKIEVVEASQPLVEDIMGRPRGYLAAPTNISKNQTLEGHTASVTAMAWNQKQKKLTTADTKGLTIVWKFCRGSWCEEMVHNREGASVQDLSWSTCGKKICIVYCDGAVMVGSCDGRRLWGYDSIIPNVPLTTLSWTPTGSHILFAASNGEILVYTQDGTPDKKVKLKQRPGLSSEGDRPDNEPTDIICIRWHKASSSCSSWTVPTLAIIWRSNFMHFLRSLTDDHPVMAKSHMVATCGAWSANGDFLAVGGSAIDKHAEDPSKLASFDQVNVFSPYGKFLQTIKIPGKNCSTLSWDSLSLRLAIGVGENVYFANVRPCYKFALVGKCTLVYAFSRCDGAAQIGFWDGQSLSVQEIPGKVVDIKGNDDHCAILALTTTACYTATILNTHGDPVDCITIVAIDPFMINLTNSVLVCIAPNGIMLWRFESNNTDESHSIPHGADLVARRRIRTFHIDESPSIIGDSTEETKLKEVAKDPASCSDAAGQMLIVCRESGKLQVYSLPHGALMNTIDTAYEMNFRPSRIWLNMDASQVAMIDRHGHLSVCSLGSASIKTALARKLDRKDVWNLMWASDHPNLICVMEKTKMYVIRNGEAEEPLLTSAYLAKFKDLKVTSVLMDELMFNPEEPRQDLILTHETRTLCETKTMIESNAPLADTFAHIESKSHSRLWKLLGDEALRQNDFELAEASFVKAADFGGISVVKKVTSIPNTHLQQAEVATYFGDFERAESLYVAADCRDLARDMWKQLGDWKKVDQLAISKQTCSDSAAKEIALAKGDVHFENEDWGRALNYYERAEETAKMIQCLLMLEDYPKMEKMAASMRDGDPLLLKIANVFHSRGLCKEAIHTYLKYDSEKPEQAVEIAISLAHWSLALQVAQSFSLSIVEPILVQCLTRMLEDGRVLQAVQLMVKSNKPIGAGKLLIIACLDELRRNAQDLLRIKKLLVFAAMLLDYRGIMLTRKENSPGFISSNREQQTEDNGDAFFENSLPEQYRPNPEVYRWMRESPWRGAEAVHYLLLAQRLIYKGYYEEATRTTLYLRSFVDILGEERVYSIIALSAANSGNNGVCSKAMIYLEPLDPEFEDIVSELFSEKFPEDRNVRTVICNKCGGAIPDYSTCCPECAMVFDICAITGRPLSDDTLAVWKCHICRHSSDLNLVQRRHSCPFCHSERFSSLDGLA